MSNQNIHLILILFIIFALIFICFHQYQIRKNKYDYQKSLYKRDLIKNDLKKIIVDPDSNPNSVLTPRSIDIDLGNYIPSENDISIADSFLPPKEKNLLIKDTFSDAYNISNKEYKNLIESGVPNLNTQQCWLSKEFECPSKNGSYLQCTNNYIPKPEQKNCDCSNRTFEMCPYPYKISENEYYKKIDFSREKEFPKVSYV